MIFGGWEIGVMQADGSDRRHLLQDGGFEYYAGWSPDGRQIVFESLRDGNAEIYTVNADGTDLRRLTLNDPFMDLSPAWLLIA
jgi:Tol biopolymer transport system component